MKQAEQHPLDVRWFNKYAMDQVALRKEPHFTGTASTASGPRPMEVDALQQLRRQRRRSGFQRKANALVRRSSTMTADVGLERLRDDSDTSNLSGLESGPWLLSTVGFACVSKDSCQ